jgi:predicted amidohydrolase
VSRPLRLALAQTAPHLLDPEANVVEVDRISGVHPDRDLIVFPELSLTGYGIGGRARALAARAGVDEPLGPPYSGLPTAGPELLLGLPTRGNDGRLYNSSVLLSGGAVRRTFKKSYLPTYGMFDEGRIFAPSSDPPEPFRAGDHWTVGVLVCEDFWHPAMAWLLAMRGVDLLVVQAAAPGRGGLEDSQYGVDDSRSFRSMGAWTAIARATAFQLGIFVALANRVGVEGSLTFGGGSLIMGPDGELLEQGGGTDTAILSADLDRDALLRARRHYSHLRDEDPSIVLRALLMDHGLPDPEDVDR